MARKIEQWSNKRQAVPIRLQLSVDPALMLPMMILLGFGLCLRLHLLLWPLLKTSRRTPTRSSFWPSSNLTAQKTDFWPSSNLTAQKTAFSFKEKIIINYYLELQICREYDRGLTRNSQVKGERLGAAI